MNMKLPTLLSFNAGYVDTAGYLALHGLFTAHVTGNFVTLGASFVHGATGAVAKLLALPMFCLVVALIRILDGALTRRGASALQSLLALKVALLFIGGALAIRLGPFADGDAWPALATGLTLVSAMAIQNAIQRIHLGKFPPTTLMTGSTTQIMIDLTDLWRGISPESRAAVSARLSQLALNVSSFAVGCAAGAALFGSAGQWCFALPPLVGLLTLLAARTPAANASRT